MTEHIDGHNRIVVTPEPDGKLRIDCYRARLHGPKGPGYWDHIYGGIHPATTFSTPITKDET